MNRIAEVIVGAALLLTAVVASAAAPQLGPAHSPEMSIIQVQYGGDLCGNWHRECARLYGQGTYHWNACMNQPAAQYDCGGGGGYGSRGGYGSGYGGGYVEDRGPNRRLCANWQRQCSRLYGWGSQAYRSCMYQPQARSDCGRY